ncbi:D-beta-hydroxybutyrate dehydrogenase [Endozoicomonas sp. OPT23]|uniref:3-hydroxybutyrate dehydrogenase n=1 Tax=Endozoicomonas sp. OPT23 TaxID=2072845 RepID=UPI00129B4A00|nr:3-hydroxybutyrate dehydrogenase [Endozoicomonas sp. OPT23]MRI35194.1 D-beta-hydroxybutyrate dehydrogenase [Endozoicomonas sp. OPT23]
MRTALVTGAASGIGKAIAIQLAQSGYKVLAVDQHVIAEAELTHSKSIETATIDLSDFKACRALVKDFGAGIDVLVNNAGFQHVCAIEDFPLATWQKMQDVMVTAPFVLTQAVWPAMKAKGWGRIINIASVHGLVASLYKSSYITAKHGLIGLTKTLALEGGEHGITANAICPGYVRTPLVESQIADQARLLNIPEEQVISDVMLKNAAIKRLLSADEIAAMALYLCTDAAGCVTGSSWTIDQGWTAQ